MDIKNVSNLCISCHHNCYGFCAGRTDFYGMSVDIIEFVARCPEYTLSFDLFCKKLYEVMEMIYKEIYKD